MDDFEWNLEPREGQYILKAEVAPILSALVQAIQETGTNNRIIITCRYDFDSDLLEVFYKQGLEPLKNAELNKKLSRLENFSSDKVSDALREQALALADGNPRLLEFLNNEILGKQDTEDKLTELERSPALWKNKVIWDELYQLIDELLQKILSYCLVYDIPVPMSALSAVSNSLPNYQWQLERGQELGLIEVSPEADESKRVYRVSRILPHIIPTIRLPEAPQVYSLYKKAHEKLYQLWGNKENESKEKWQEIFRLKFANKENTERFRQGFSQMLAAVQYNSEANQAFEEKLRKVADNLVEEGLCTQLENYLQHKQWKEADEETAWIFYQVMVREKYKDWGELLMNFPCETLKEINQLWFQNSNNKFGISIQTEIYQRLGSPSYGDDNWEAFGDCVGWTQGCLYRLRDWLSYGELIEKFENYKEGMPPDTPHLPILPALIYTGLITLGAGMSMSVVWVSLLSHRDL